MVFFIFIKILKEFLFANSGEPDQTPHFVASDLVLHCLPMSHKKDARLLWVECMMNVEASQSTSLRYNVKGQLVQYS